MGLTTHQTLGTKLRISAAVLVFPLGDFIECARTLPLRPFGYKNLADGMNPYEEETNL